MRAHERACVYVGRTREDPSVDTHSGSKPGRADRSGQSASALSLFKVRLTLSTIPEKKSRPGPPILSSISRVHVSRSLSFSLYSFSSIDLPVSHPSLKFHRFSRTHLWPSDPVPDTRAGKVLPHSSSESHLDGLGFRILHFIFLIFLNTMSFDILILHLCIQSKNVAIHLSRLSRYLSWYS